MNKIFNKIGFCTLAFFATLFCAGAFHEYISCIVSFFLAGWIVINHMRTGKTVIYKNYAFLWAGVTVLFYGVSAFWAVDSGMAFIGFLKYLPLLLFAVVLMQSDERVVILTLFPYTAAGMVVLSALLAQIPSISNYFLVDDRLSGFLQYPNTFAILLLVAELIIITKPKIKNFDVAVIVILLVGLVFSTSRTVLLIALVANIIAILIYRSKRFIFCSFLALIGGGFLSIVILLSTNNASIIERMFSFSFENSSFANRFLYYADALPTALKNPLGTGYMGYSYMQSSFQSGIYSVSFVHNDFLQLMLDIGWIPAILFGFTVLKSVLAKKTNRTIKLILTCLIVHSLFDFNLQFLTVGFLFLILLDVKKGQKVVIKDTKWLIRGVSAILACASVYVGMSLVLYKADYHAESYALYPFNTNTETALMLNGSHTDKTLEIAEDMQDRNEYMHISYVVKAQYAFKNGDYKTLIKQMNKAFEVAPFVYQPYEDYARMLMQGVSEFQQKNDTESAQMCIDELKTIPEKLAALEDKVSYLGSLQDEQPKTALPENLTNFINNLS